MTALIAIAKNEQLYIAEWIEYHLSLGFDRLIIADNDDDLILSGYASDKVIIEDYTKVEGVQTKAYTELFDKYRKDYDWFFFADIDEFLVLEHEDLNTFLASFPPKTELIRLNCKHFTDNEELDVIDGDYRVFERFKTPIALDNDRFCKCFVHKNIRNRHPYVFAHGVFLVGLRVYDALGRPTTNDNRKTPTAVLQRAWVNHYRTKTIGEYIRQKLFRGGPNLNPQRYNLDYFWVTNKKTPEKEAYANKIIKDFKND